MRKDRILESIHQYGLFAAGILTGLGIVASTWFAVGALAVICELSAMARMKEMGFL